jgi:transposase
MEFIQGESRNQIQLFPSSIDEMISEDNTVRAIDIFVDSLNLETLDFNLRLKEGRPPYNPADLLKLFIYGYMNRMRSSRQLEKECYRNIELIWLLKSLKPDHNTIARFRKDNDKAIKKVFHQTVTIARNFSLIGALLIAGDSTKIRAQNSKKNNYNPKKIKRHLDYIDGKLNQYQKEIQQTDEPQKRKVLTKEIAKHNNHKQKYQNIEKQLKETGDTQVSTSDPESRHQITRGNITEVCYTLQTTVDDDNKIIIDYLVTNQNDKKAMGGMLRRAKTILRTNDFTALYDKGYHTGSEFSTADELGIETLVAIPSTSSRAPHTDYELSAFSFCESDDSYTCPQGHILKSNGSWYTTRNYRFKQYKTSACKSCPVRHLCTSSKANGRILQRSEHQGAIEANSARISASGDLYKKRQAIVEHPYGTIKRNWGFDHIITKKGINRASADTGFMLIAYNLRRILNILGVVKFTELLRKLDNSINKLFRFIGRIISAIIDSRMHYNGNPKQTLNFQLYDA